jgi:hypothetical protein
MAKKKKRKPSAYNKHIGREMKKGFTMAEAAASWSKKPTKKKTKSKPRKITTRKRSTRKKTTRKPRGQKVLFPVVNRMLFNGGPIRTKIGRFLGR